MGLTGVGRGYRESVAVPYLGLGLIGFPFLLASLFFFMLHLGRRKDSAVSWLIVIALTSGLVRVTEGAIAPGTTALAPARSGLV